jgi:hypothetical protein
MIGFHLKPRLSEVDGIHLTEFGQFGHIPVIHGLVGTALNELF